MSYRRMLLSLSLGFGVMVGGCQKEEPKAPPAAAQPAVQQQTGLGAVSQTVTPMAAEAKEALAKQAQAVQTNVVTSAAGKAAQEKLDQVAQYVKEKKFDVAETAIKELESVKSSLPAALQPRVEQARAMLTAAKLGTGPVPAAPAFSTTPMNK